AASPHMTEIRAARDAIRSAILAARPQQTAPEGETQMSREAPDDVSSAREELRSLADRVGVSDYMDTALVFERLIERGQGGQFGVTEQDAVRARDLVNQIRGVAEENPPERVSSDGQIAVS